ncbi:hypothetical protein [Cryptosporangium arvum]|uniref:Uncharacterized protein n=1 Tax=Cryptosporangium arvum DSM 44712 TaxID=927661 RepID=A0A010YZ02_9ACTN|nr:hypothetical protein [Cryptosporangium arvum]EXG80453.1 hypothetical protein CryarDRAFT_1527 [Cryptosporangium arvum DSM 44712]
MTWVPPSSGESSRQPAGEPYDPPVPGSPPGYDAPGYDGSGYGGSGYGGPGYGSPAQGGPGYGPAGHGGAAPRSPAPGGPPHGVGTKAVSEREARRQRALRALPPPPSAPAGMGAVPAFAPPMPRPNRTVLIVSLVLGATLLLCCGGGVGGVGGLLYYTYENQRDDAVTAVQSYLGDLQNARYDQAYGRLCAEARSERSLGEFTEAEQVAGQVGSFAVSDQPQTDQDGNWVVAAQVTRQGNSVRSELFPVTFESGSTVSVCPG